MALLLELAPHHLVRLIVADELHLVRDQGVAFRDAFQATGKEVIEKITSKSPRTTIVAFTATATLEDIAYVEQLYHFETTSILWATPKDMEKRTVRISMLCRQYFSSDIVLPVMRKGDKFIIFVDMESGIKPLQEKLRTLAYDKNIENFRTLELSGGTCSAMKRQAVNIFCNNVDDTDGGAFARSLAHYKVLIGTSDATATGIDPRVQEVFRFGCPPRRSTVWQELGRLFRFGSDASLEYLYHVTVNVQSYASLLLRTERNEKASTKEKKRIHAEQLNTLRLLVWNRECFHSALERHFGRPGSIQTMPSTCSSQCPYCSGERSAFEAAFFTPRLQRALADIFLNEKCDATLSNAFVTRLRSVTLEKKVWANAAKTAPLKSIQAFKVQFLTLQLLASEILLCSPQLNEKKEWCVRLRPAKTIDGIGFKFSDVSSFDQFQHSTPEPPPLETTGPVDDSRRG